MTGRSGVEAECSLEVHCHSIRNVGKRNDLLNTSAYFKDLQSLVQGQTLMLLVTFWLSAASVTNQSMPLSTL
jgi:hypothetical protein